MPYTKQYSIRERIIDRCLSRGWHSRAQLEDACNRELYARGYEMISSRSTIQKDLTDIGNKYNVIIEKKRDGRTPLYRYADPSFSIYKSELSEEDFQRLSTAMDVLSRFQGLPQFDWVDELNARLNDSIKSGRSSIVGFEDAVLNVGMENFSPIFNAIKQKMAIDITYKSFKMNEPQIFSISPYYLKQYNNRWFLLGRTLGYENMGVFPLDRIERIKNVGKAYEPCDINFDEYFEDVVGVSKPMEETELVEMWFSHEQLNYIKTKPIHVSQRIIESDSAGGIIQLDVIINYELEQLVLSFGEKAKVLSPDTFRERIKQRIEKSQKNY